MAVRGKFSLAVRGKCSLYRVLSKAHSSQGYAAWQWHLGCHKYPLYVPHTAAVCGRCMWLYSGLVCLATRQLLLRGFWLLVGVAQGR